MTPTSTEQTTTAKAPTGATYMQGVHAVGVKTQVTPTSPGYRLLFASAVTDFTILLAAYCAFFWATGLPPFMRLPQLMGLAAWITAYFTLQRVTRGMTLGQWAWSLGPSRHRDVLLDFRAGAPLSSRIIGILLTTISATALGFALWTPFLSHPLWSRATEQKLEAALPTGPEWQVSPYYYTLGAWPVRFENKPVFLELPYHPGPPQVFVAKIIARWSTPNITFFLEGPKTPQELASIPQSRNRIKECLVHSRGSALECLKLRNLALSRHIEEMSRLGRAREIARHWEIRWLSVQTTRETALTEKENPQGIYLSACAAHACEDRFVLITPKGVHQTFILRAETQNAGALEQPGPRRSQWLTARATFEKSLRSLRVSEDLQYGRAWIDRQIEDTRVRDVLKQKDRAAVIQKLAETQAVLLSKISVEPSVYESYYFLAQLGLTLGRLAARDAQASTLEDWPSIARPLVMSAARYAKDIAPQDRRNPELDGLVAEAQKY